MPPTDFHPRRHGLSLATDEDELGFNNKKDGHFLTSNKLIFNISFSQSWTLARML